MVKKRKKKERNFIKKKCESKTKPFYKVKGKSVTTNDKRIGLTMFVI